MYPFPLHAFPSHAQEKRASLLSGLEALAVGVPEDLCAYMAASSAQAKGKARRISPLAPGQPQPRPQGGEGGPDWPLVCSQGAAALGIALHALHCRARAPLFRLLYNVPATISSSSMRACVHAVRGCRRAVPCIAVLCRLPQQWPAHPFMSLRMVAGVGLSQP